MGRNYLVRKKAQREDVSVVKARQILEKMKEKYEWRECNGLKIDNLTGGTSIAL